MSPASRGLANHRGFDAEHIGGRTTQVTIAQCIGQGLFIDQPAAGGVDHQGSGLEQGQFPGTDKVAGVLVEGAVQGQGVHLRQQFLQRQAVRAGRAAWNLPQHHTHAKGFGQAGHRAAQFAIAQQAQGLARQFDDRVVQQAELTGLLPAPGSHGLLVIGDPGGQVEQQHQGVLGHRGSAVALAVADGNPQLAGCGQVDIVGAGGGHQDQLQVGAGGQGFGCQCHLVADGHPGALQALGDLFRRCVGMYLQRAEAVMQRTQVQVTEVQ